MKSLFLSFIASLCIVGGSWAQSPGVAKAQNQKELSASKLNGSYSFILPSGTSEDVVKKSAGYYVQYFSVNYSVKTAQANITMVENDERSRSIIIRFLTSVGIKSVLVENKPVELSEFFTKYLK